MCLTASVGLSASRVEVSAAVFLSPFLNPSLHRTLKGREFAMRIAHLRKGVQPTLWTSASVAEDCWVPRPSWGCEGSGILAPGV